MNQYDIGIRIAQRFLYGYLHHAQLASFFDALEIGSWGDKHRDYSIKDAHNRQFMDEYIVHKTKRVPVYTADVKTVLSEIINIPHENLRQNEKHWLKLGMENSIHYEKETIRIFEDMKKNSKELKDENLERMLEKFIRNSEKEIKENEHDLSELQKHNFDFDKFIKEKGVSKMREFDDWYDDDDRWDEPWHPHHEPMMGFEDRRGVPGTGRGRRNRSDMEAHYWRHPGFIPYMPFMPFMDDDMEMRRGVPGTGRYSRISRRRRR